MRRSSYKVPPPPYSARGLTTTRVRSPITFVVGCRLLIDASHPARKTESMNLENTRRCDPCQTETRRFSALQASTTIQYKSEWVADIDTKRLHTVAPGAATQSHERTVLRRQAKERSRIAFGLFDQLFELHPAKQREKASRVDDVRRFVGTLPPQRIG